MSDILDNSEYDPVNLKIGELIRKRRKQLNLTQKELAEKLSITAQQVQKYETGNNKLNINRLVEFSKALFIPISYFFITAYNASNSSLREPEEIFNFEEMKEGEINEISLKEIDNFLHKFLSLRKETQKYVIAIVNELSINQKK